MRQITKKLRHKGGIGGAEPRPWMSLGQSNLQKI